MNVGSHGDVVGAVGAEVIHDVCSPRRERLDSLRVLARPMGYIFDSMCEYDFRHNTCSCLVLNHRLKKQTEGFSYCISAMTQPKMSSARITRNSYKAQISV